MINTQEATVPAQAHTRTDEAATSAKSKYDALSILKNIYEDASWNLFKEWDMDNLIRLIQKTFDFIAGVNDDEKYCEYDLLHEWTDFVNAYSPAYYTVKNYLSVEYSKVEYQDELKQVTGNE